MRRETILEIHRQGTRKIVSVRRWILDRISLSILVSFLGELVAGGIEQLGPDSLQHALDWLRIGKFLMIMLIPQRSSDAEGAVSKIRPVSFSCLGNSRSIAQPYRCRISGATGENDYTPTPHEWNKNWQSTYNKTR
jgi:hypothetical protein